MLRIFWMFTCTTFLRQPVLPLIDNQVHFTNDCLASLSNLDDLVQTYLSHTKYTFWLLTASVHCKSWTAAYEASTGPHEYSSVTVSSYLLLTSLYIAHIIVRKIIVMINDFSDYNDIIAPLDKLIMLQYISYIHYTYYTQYIHHVHCACAMCMDSGIRLCLLAARIMSTYCATCIPVSLINIS